MSCIATGASVELPPATSGERVPAVFAPDDDRIRATPRARRIAEEKSIDLSEVTGSGTLSGTLSGRLATAPNLNGHVTLSNLQVPLPFKLPAPAAARSPRPRPAHPPCPGR